MAENTPLLSICIPTCNRAEFLRVMLQALLPQVREFGDQVEVWVLDNASTDQTPQVLAESTVLGPFRVHRQHQNVGPTRNIVCGPATLATGKYVWVLGDHNLLRLGALGRLLECLMKHPEHELFYVNFLAAAFPAQWPETAAGGHEGEYQYLGNPEIADGVVAQWHQLIRPYSALCTQNYVHIVAAAIWKKFWRNGVYGEDYSSALTTYPHTMTILRCCSNMQAVMIGDPLITIFNGAQSWRNPFTRIKVYFRGLPELLCEMRAQGVPCETCNLGWRHFYLKQGQEVMTDARSSIGLIRVLQAIIQDAKISRQNWLLLIGMIAKQCFPWIFRLTGQCQESLGKYKSWYLYNFRPARFFRRIWQNKNVRESDQFS